VRPVWALEADCASCAVMLIMSWWVARAEGEIFDRACAGRDMQFCWEGEGSGVAGSSQDTVRFYQAFLLNGERFALGALPLQTLTKPRLEKQAPRQTGG
jgi:hypothetical protein